MAHILTNRGIYYLQNNAISGTTDIRAGVITNASLPSDAAIRDYNFVSELLTSGTGPATEAAVSGYARQDLASVTLTEVDGSDWVTLTTANATMNNVAAGETWAGIFYYIEGASDAARTLLSVDKVTTPIPTNGGNVTISGLSLTIGQDTIIGT